MNEAAKEARRRYKREWNKAHPESVRRSQERYWTRRAEREQAQAEENRAKGQADASSL